jgi:hypothetical protein
MTAMHRHSQASPIWIRCAILLLALASPLITQAAVSLKDLGIDPDVAYAGDRVIRSSEIDRAFTLREHRTAGKARMEYAEEGQTVVMLLDEQQEKAFMLMPAMNFYMTVSVGEFQARLGDIQETATLNEFERQDRETINGHSATRYKVSLTDDEGNQGEGFHWVTDEGVPIKMDLTFRSTDGESQRIQMELQNLVIGAQDPALFVVPAGYQAMPSIDQLIGFPSGAPATDGKGTSEGINAETVREGVGDLLKRMRGG